MRKSTTKKKRYYQKKSEVVPYIFTENFHIDYVNTSTEPEEHLGMFLGRTPKDGVLIAAKLLFTGRMS